MEYGSSSKCSWADEVDEEEFAASARLNSNAAPFPGGSSPVGSAGLNPDAQPFSPPGAGYGERLAFTDSEASDGSESDSPPPEGKGKAVAMGGRHRRRPRCRRRARNPGDFIAAAHRGHPPIDGPSQTSRPRCVVGDRRSRSPVAHPARTIGAPNADGFHRVQSHRRWRRRTPPRQSKPVPPHLNGKCFNCGALTISRPIAPPVRDASIAEVSATTRGSVHSPPWAQR